VEQLFHKNVANDRKDSFPHEVVERSRHALHPWRRIINSGFCVQAQRLLSTAFEFGVIGIVEQESSEVERKGELLPALLRKSGLLGVIRLALAGVGPGPALEEPLAADRSVALGCRLVWQRIGRWVSGLHWGGFAGGFTGATQERGWHSK
jgi:hypothetical protein